MCVANNHLGDPTAVRARVLNRYFPMDNWTPAGQSLPMDTPSALAFIALKKQFKDALQKATKRNLPFLLAVSSWCNSYLKNKKRRKKLLYFWKMKSVPRFLILYTIAVAQAWRPLKYGDTLFSLLSEISFVRQTAPRRQLLEMAQAGVPNAQTQLNALVAPPRPLHPNAGAVPTSNQQ